MDLTEPFTPALAARAGIGRSALERSVREGRTVRLVRGVYVDAAVPLTPIVRARALSLVVSRRHVIVDRTAAWVHGAPALRTEGDDALPLDLLGRRRFPGGRLPLGPGDVTLVGGLRCTSPLRTACDVARHLAPERALPLLDGLLRSGAIRHPDLIARAESTIDLPGGRQARELAAIADGRAADVAESVLRLRWLAAHLPTPVPGLRVTGVRTALGLPLHRFAVTLRGAATEADLLRTATAGWRVVVLDRGRVRSGDADATGGHLEREFHRSLLSQMG